MKVIATPKCKSCNNTFNAHTENSKAVSSNLVRVVCPHCNTNNYLTVRTEEEK